MFKSMLKNRRNHEIFLLPVFHFLNSGVFFQIIHVLRGLKMKKAFFLDRDGVIIEDGHYLSDSDQVVLCPGAAAAVNLMHEAGYLVIAVSNQSGIARGYFTEEQLASVERRINELLAKEGAKIDGWYYCMHHVKGVIPELACDCDCRKPKPGMFLHAAQDFGIDLAESFMIGDKVSDIQAAENANCRKAVLVLTGHGAEEEGKPGLGNALIEEDILDAAKRLLRMI